MNGNNPNVVEMELAVPMPVQYSTLRLHGAKEVPPGATREDTWDALADELAEQAERQAARIDARLTRGPK